MEIGSRQTVSYASLTTAGESMYSVRGTIKSDSISDLLPAITLDHSAQSNPSLSDYCSRPRPIAWRLLLLVPSVLNILPRGLVSLCPAATLKPAFASSWRHRLRVRSLRADTLAVCFVSSSCPAPFSSSCHRL